MSSSRPPYGSSRPPGNNPVQQDKPNTYLNQYTTLLKSVSFTDDRVMQLSEPLSESLTVNPNARFGEGKDNTKTQVRKFYNLVRVAQTQAKSNDTSPESIKIKLRTLQAQIAYAVARKTVSPDFKKFFDDSLNTIITSKDIKESLKQFATFFESFYAYFYYHTEMKKR